jgi:plasmid stabilization system protein ParE
MSRLLSIHETAEIEINEIADFYDLVNPGLGMVFINEIHRTIQNIDMFPDAAPIVRGRIRKRMLLKFPYSLIYSLRPDEIRILAVAHQKRRPFYWHGRR